MVNTQIRSLTSAEYYQMMESGIIRAGEKVELILGQIFAMVAKGTRRTVATTKLLKSLLTLIGARAIVRCQDPISLSNHSEPEPDIVIARLRLDNYVNSHPSPTDIVLVIKVADSTIKFVGVGVACRRHSLFSERDASRWQRLRFANGTRIETRKHRFRQQRELVSIGS